MKADNARPDQIGLGLRDPSTSVAPVEKSPEAISATELRKAIRLRRKVRIGYRADDGTVSQRTVWPVLVGYRDSGRILAAWCELREAFRYFRTDRMSAAELLEELIPDRQPSLRLRWEAAMSAEREKYAEADR